MDYDLNQRSRKKNHTRSVRKKNRKNLRRKNNSAHKKLKFFDLFNSKAQKFNLKSSSKLHGRNSS